MAIYPEQYDGWSTHELADGLLKLSKSHKIIDILLEQDVVVACILQFMQKGHSSFTSVALNGFTESKNAHAGFIGDIYRTFLFVLRPLK